MADKKIIAVLGATGAQGGGLVRAILADPAGGFIPRALTRDVNSKKARELAQKGAEVVAANVDDVESLKQAFAGAHGAFCVTFYWEHMSPEKEFAQGKALAEAAKAAGLAHVIWSTFEDTRNWVPLTDDRMPTLMGKYKVPHFDAKAEANVVFLECEVPTTFLLTSFYWENFINFGLEPRQGPDGRWAITLPMADKKVAGIASEDIGKCAYGIFKKGAETIGQTIGISSEQLTGAQMAAGLSRALGKEIHFNDVPPEVFRTFGFPGADDIANMFQFTRDFEEVICGARNPAVARALNPSLQTFDVWLAQNKDRIPLVPSAT